MEKGKSQPSGPSFQWETRRASFPTGTRIDPRVEIFLYFILSSESQCISNMDKSDIFTAELILIFSLVIDISRYFHCRVWITSDVSIHLTSLNVPHFSNSNAYNSVIYERKHKVWVFIFLVRMLGTMWYQNYLCFQKFLVFVFSPPAL